MGSHIFHALPEKDLPTAIKGDGIYIYDTNGKRYLDASSGPMAVNLGHSLEAVTSKMKEQLDTLSYVFRHQFHNLPAEELAKKIASLTPGLLNRVNFVNSGSEANETAIKVAKSYWNAKGKTGKQMIISQWTSYHGSTMGAMSMSGLAARRQSFHPYLSKFHQMEPPFCYHCPFEKTYPDCSLLCARQLEKTIDRFGQDNISAFIAEPIVAAAGAGITPPDDYFPLIEQICRKKEVLFILDEVVTGFGRTGHNFACQHWQVEPDIIVFGKGVSSGYSPLSGIITSEEIYETIKQGGGNFSTGHTYNGNPLSCTVGCSVLDYIIKNKMVEGNVKKGLYLKNRLAEIAEESELIGDIRGRGLLLGVELVENKEKREPFPRKMKVAERLVEICQTNGLIIYPSTGMIDGVRGDAVLLAPPFIIQNEEIDNLVDILVISLQKLQKEVSQ